MGKIVLAVSIFAFLSLIFMPAGASAKPLSHPAVQAAGSTPQLVGEVSHNGMLIVLWYNDQIGQTHFVKNGQLYRFDTVSISVYNPSHTPTLNIAIEQYTLSSRTVTVTSNNETYTKTLFVQQNEVFDNQTIPVAYRTISEGNISLPYTSSEMSITVNANGAIFQFKHLSIPPANQVPFVNAPVTMLIFLIVVIGIAYALATAMAAGFIKKVKYWPRLTGSHWFVVLFFLSLAAGLFYYEFFYDVPVLPWYSFLVPAFIMFFLIMTNLWPQTYKSWALRSYPQQASKREDSAVTWNRRIYAVPDDTDFNIPGYRYSGYIRVSRLSRAEAFKRLFGKKIPILFPEGDEPTKLGDESLDPLDGENREYILKAGEKAKVIMVRAEADELEQAPGKKAKTASELTDPEMKRRRFRKDKEVKPEKSKAIKAYFIPVSHWHTLDLADFLSRSRTESTLSTKLESCLVEKTQLEASKELKYLDTTDMGLDILLKQLKTRRKKETGEDKDGRSVL